MGYSPELEAMAPLDVGTVPAIVQDFLSSAKGGNRKLPVDGHNGIKTLEAIKDYQKSVGIEMTGKLDAKTQAAMGDGGFDFDKAKEALKAKNPELMKHLEVLDKHNAEIKSIRDTHQGVGASGASSHEFGTQTTGNVVGRGGPEAKR